METKQLFRESGILCIDDKDYDIQKLTFAQVSLRYRTGRAFLISGNGRDKKMGYRVGCMTEIGDIEHTQWIELVQYMIERDGEQQLQKDLFSWVKEKCLWLHFRNEWEEYALELHAARIFDCKEWVCYEEFNKLYRPEVLQDKSKGGCTNECE